MRGINNSWGGRVGPVEAQRNLGLIGVEVITADAGYGLHVRVILLQHFSVVLRGRRNVVHLLRRRCRTRGEMWSPLRKKDVRYLANAVPHVCERSLSEG